MRITDSTGAAASYLPVNLEAGEESAPLSLIITPEGEGERLRSSYSPDASILGRVAGAGVYQDLYVAPLSLSAYYGGSVTVEIKIAASAAVAGVRRVGSFLGVTRGAAAGWTV